MRNILNFWRAAGIEGKLLLVYPVMMAFITRGNAKVSDAVVQTSITLQIVYSFIIMMILVSQFQNGKINHIISIIKSSPLSYFFVFIALSFLSFLWSSNPILTLYRSFEMFVFTWLILSVIYNLFSLYTLDQVIQWLIFYAFWNLVVHTIERFLLTSGNPFIIPFLPSRLFFPLFSFIILFYAKNIKSKIITMSVVIFGISTKVFLGLSLGFLSFIFGNSKVKALFIFLLFGLVFLLLFIDLEELLFNTVFYGRDKIGLDDSSGRDKVWEYLINKGMEQPIFGYGFAAGEEFLLQSAGLGAINAHNTFLSSFIGTGILGLLSVSIFIFSTFRKVLFAKLSMNNLKSVLMGTIIIIIIVSSSGPGIGSRVYGAWIPSMVLMTFIIFVCCVQIESDFEDENPIYP